jgi:hypothetical protein
MRREQDKQQPEQQPKEAKPQTVEQWLTGAVNIVSSMSLGGMFARWFKKPETWSAWLAFLKAMFGLELSDSERAIYQQCTGRTDLPTEGFTEAWLCVGRRGGKSLVLALIATYLAAVLLNVAHSICVTRPTFRSGRTDKGWLVCANETGSLENVAPVGRTCRRSGIRWVVYL